VRRIVWLIGFVALVTTPTGCSITEESRSDLPIESDFSDRDGWATKDNEHLSLGCGDGQYRVLYKDTSAGISDFMPRRSKDRVDSVRLQADIAFRTVPPGTAERTRFIAAGLVCWVALPDEPAKGYYFLVTADERISILKLDETEGSLEEQFYLRPLVDKESSAVQATGGEANQVRAECRRTGSRSVELRMWVNGVQVGDVTESDGFFGYEAFGFGTVLDRKQNGLSVRQLCRRRAPRADVVPGQRHRGRSSARSPAAGWNALPPPRPRQLFPVTSGSPVPTSEWARRELCTMPPVPPLLAVALA
jgi:hypothetical protein